MRSRSIVLTAALAAVFAAAVFVWQSVSSQTIRLSCSTADMGLFDAQQAIKDIPRNVESLTKLVGGELPLSARVAAFEKVVCDKSNSVTLRGLALDQLFETTSVLAALDAGKSLSGNWENRVTGATGTVVVLMSVRIQGRQCYEVASPSTFPGIGTLVATMIEEFCRVDNEWRSNRIAGMVFYGYERGTFGVQPK